MGGEKFIRQLPLVIAIILMISNCQSANDSYNGDDGSGGYGTGATDSSGGALSSGAGGSSGSSGGYMGPNAGMSTGASDPSDGVVVQLPQQVGTQWQMVSTKLSTVTKYDIYTRMTAYYSALSNTTNLQSQMINNRAAMGTMMPGMGVNPMGSGMMPGGGMNPMGGGMMPPMMTPNMQSAQMAQAAQMNAAQLQQRVQMLMQQLYMVQTQNQQLQMHIQSGMGSRVGEEEDDASDNDNLEGTNQSQSGLEAQEKLKEIAALLGVGEDSDLANAVEERLTKPAAEVSSEEAAEWEKKYNALADMIPKRSGETVEEALERILNRPQTEEVEEDQVESSKPNQARTIREAEDAEDAAEDEAVIADAAPTKAARKAIPLEEAEGEEEDALEDDIQETEEKETIDAGNLELHEVEAHVFHPNDAPGSLTAIQKAQLVEWRKRREELERLANCAPTNHAFSEPQEWAFLKQAFDMLKKFAQCS